MRADSHGRSGVGEQSVDGGTEVDHQDGDEDGDNEDNDDNDSNNVTQDEEEECSICLTSYQQKDMLRTLPCGHSFHKDCIDRWLEQSTSCPFCKQPLPLSPPPL